MSNELVKRNLHKFGGSSLADADCYQRVVKLLAGYSQSNDLIVVSAAGNTTNQLIEWIELSQTDPVSADQAFTLLYDFQSRLIIELLATPQADLLLNQLQQDLNTLKEWLDLRVDDKTYSEIVGYGEIWSARLLAEVLSASKLTATWIDARDFLCAERSALPQIDVIASKSRFLPLLERYPDIRLVITGFISRNRAGETVLLGRNGSDYSATQIGALADVSLVTIWSDVAGVYSADPHRVSQAQLLPLLRLDEASELARLAAPVLHSRTLQPMADSNINLVLRSSKAPESGNTQIERVLASGLGAKIVTNHNEIGLIEIVIAAQFDFETIQKQIELLLQQADLTPLAIGIQAERRILQLCFTQELIEGAYIFLQHSNQPIELNICSAMSLIAIVGAGVTNNLLHCHRFYQALIDLPVEFIWQSEEAVSIVAVLRLDSTDELLNQLHQHIFSPEKKLGLVLFGKGNIASQWLELFAGEQQQLVNRTGRAFTLIGVVSSDRYWLDYCGLDPLKVITHYDDNAISKDNHFLKQWMLQHPFDDLVIIDVTTSEIIANQYHDFAGYGFHVISANKLPGSSTTKNFKRIQQAFAKTGRYWLYNATVAGSLPVNFALRDLHNSGDTILSVSGIFSGTLSLLFQQFDGSVPFTQLVEQAWQQGLTEPDPRDDLSGQDVVRKLVILVREAGYDIEPSQIKVDSLLTTQGREGSIDSFFENSHELNEYMLDRLEQAKDSGLLLRYVARFSSNGKASVGVEEVTEAHPLAVLRPCDNIFVIQSRWYRDNPMIIQGPVTGQFVGAGAIQSDLNRLARLL